MPPFSPQTLRVPQPFRVRCERVGGVTHVTDSGVPPLLPLPSCHRVSNVTTAITTCTLSPAAVTVDDRCWPRPAAAIFSLCSGRSSPAPSLRRARLCGHARTLSSADQRAARYHSIGGNAGVEAAFLAPGTESPPTTGTAHRTALPVACHRGRNLAAPLLRFQCVDGAQAHRKAALHASQSGQARPGEPARAVVLEQFPQLRVWRSVAFLPANSELNPKSRGRGARATRACIHKRRTLQPASAAAYIEASLITSLTFCSREAAENGLGR